MAQVLVDFAGVRYLRDIRSSSTRTSGSVSRDVQAVARRPGVGNSRWSFMSVIPTDRDWSF